MIHKKAAASLILISIIFGIPSFATKNTDFRSYVSGLYSDDETVRSKTEDNIRKIPDLHAQLETNLKSKDPSPAMKVIQTLHDSSLTDSVVALVRIHPETDSWVTLLSLINPKTKDRIAKVSLELLASRTQEMSPGAVVVALNIISSTHSLLPEKVAEDLLENKSYEIRLALIDYIGALVVANQGDSYLKVLAESLIEKPYQLRLKAIQVAARVPASQFQVFEHSLQTCSKDQNADVREGCKKLSALHPRGAQ